MDLVEGDVRLIQDIKVTSRMVRRPHKDLLRQEAALWSTM